MIPISIAPVYHISCLLKPQFIKSLHQLLRCGSKAHKNLVVANSLFCWILVSSERLCPDGAKVSNRGTALKSVCSAESYVNEACVSQCINDCVNEARVLQCIND